jgi:hypothetical protein
MKFQFSKFSQLHGRRLEKEIVRYSFIPHNEEGLHEHVFVYNGEIPSPQDEPDLYRGASVKKEGNSAELRYQGLEEIVELIGLIEDNEFRKQHPDLIAKELLTIDE